MSTISPIERFAMPNNIGQVFGVGAAQSIIDGFDDNPLWWESSFEIAQQLMTRYPNVNADDVGLQQVFAWVIALPNFADDPLLANDGILQDILREWYEESNPICLN